MYERVGTALQAQLSSPPGRAEGSLSDLPTQPPAGYSDVYE